jgi:gamma-glutamylcyclotransferase (GGCT)/AIG2-like uncharacterized protein YtfP
MALIFQYGSNLDVNRINSVERLGGKAVPLGVAELDGYQIIFNVFSKGNKCAVTNIHTKRHFIGKDKIYGVLFSVPDHLMDKLDSVEGVNSLTYQRANIKVKFKDAYGNDFVINAITYVGASKGLKNFNESPYKMITDKYAGFIIAGMEQFNIPRSYRAKVKAIIKEHNKNYKEIKGIVQKAFTKTNDDPFNDTDKGVRLKKEFRAFLGVTVGKKVKIYNVSDPENIIEWIFTVVKGPDLPHPGNYVYLSKKGRNKIAVNIGSEVIVEKYVGGG